MLVEIDRDGLLDGLSKTVPITEKRSTLPILSHLLVDVLSSGLTLTATDLSVGLRTVSECNVKDPGIMAIPGKKLFEIIRELPSGTVTMELLDAGQIRISTGNSEFKLASMEASDYPTFADLENVETTEVEADKLLYMIEKTLFASSNDESRFNLNGMLLEQHDQKIRLVATDGHRLALIDEDLGVSLQSKVLIPKKGLLELKRMLESTKGKIGIGFEEKNMCVKTDRFVMTIRLIEGDYPDYRKVIPSPGEKLLRADRVQLLQTIRRAAIFTSDRSRGVDVNLSPGCIEIVAVHPDLGTARDVLDVDYQGENFSLLINVSYLMEALNAVDTQEVRLEFQQEGSPVIVRPEPLKEYFNLVMPMRR